MNAQTAPQWRKASKSADSGGCIELAPTETGVLLRNSNRPELGTIAFTHHELDCFLDGAKSGEFDDLAGG